MPVMALERDWNTFLTVPVSPTSSAIIRDLGAQSTYELEMGNQDSDLRRLILREREAGAAVLARAFAEYEFLRYYFPHENQRRAIADSFVLIALSVCLKYGEAYTTSDKMEGVAGWLPPGKAPFGMWQIIRSVPLAVLFSFGRQGAGRMQAYGRFVDSLHRKLLPYPHWYLQVIGVDPAYQGQGFSSQMIRPMLERIDREQIPCALDTNTDGNVAIYRRFGFDIISENKLPGTPVTSFLMLRKPPTA